MSPSRVRVVTAAALVLTPILAAAGQSSVTVSPFVSYIPSAATNPLAGFALTFGGTTGLALRAGAEMSIANSDTLAAPGGYRPWGADADLMLFLGGLGGGATVFSRALSPYGFAGIGMFGADSAGRNVVHNGWSYGVGAAIPLGMHADIFGEARWRMTEYVLPTSQGAPDSKSSMRFGLSFHVGGSGQPAPAPRRGRRYGHAAADQDVEYVVTPAPAAQPQVVVVQPTPAPAPEPQVIYVEPEPQPQPEPVVVMSPERSRRRYPSRVTVVQPAPVVVDAPTEARPRTRVIGRSTGRSTTTVQQKSTTTTNTRVITRRPSASSSRTVVRPPSRSQVKTESRTQVKTEAKSRASVARARREAARARKDP
jgi:hypothetical protein